MSNLPKGWEEIKLIDVIASANTGLDAIKRAPIVDEDTGIKCFRIQDASQSKGYNNWGFTNVSEQNYEKFKLKKGDILIARTGNSIGVHFLVQKDMKSVFNNGLIRLRVNERIKYEFLYNIITSNKFYRHIQSIAYGTSTQPNMQINSLLSFKFVLPKLDEQKTIANILSSLDKKMELLKEQNKTLEIMAQTIFKEWFVDFNYPNAGEMIDSEMGKIPKKWRISNLKEITEVISKGTTPTKLDVEGLIEIIPFLKVKDLSDDGNIKYDSLEKIPFEIHMTVLKRSQLKANDLLYSIAGTIGRLAILPIHLDNSNCNQALAFIRLKEKNKFLEYVHQWIQTTEITNKINSSIVQGVQANVSLTVLGNLSIIIPDDETLKNWHDVIKPIYKKILNNNSQLKTIIETKITLLPKLMMGKKRVKGFENA